MGIVYDLPRIGGEGDGYGQKGPTCWYYVSKMLLKFHDKLSDKESATYKGFKRLHELRRALTALGGPDREIRSDKGEVKAVLEKFKKDLPMVPDQSGFYTDHLKKIYDYLSSGNAKISEVIQKLDQANDDWSERLSLMSAFVPTAGFKSLDKDVVFASTASLEQSLTAEGPLYVSGALAVSAKVEKNPSSQEAQDFAKALGVPDLTEPMRVKREETFNVGKVQSSGDELLGVIEMRSDSSHAIAVCGIEGDSVYYKDPQASHKLLSHPFDKMKPNIRRLITLTCNGCTHKGTKTLVLKL
jgi:hypothetical protein